MATTLHSTGFPGSNVPQKSLNSRASTSWELVYTKQYFLQGNRTLKNKAGHLCTLVAKAHLLGQNYLESGCIPTGKGW
jgi:hypothetical protein